MQLFATDSNRFPMIWFLLGLLFMAGGLYLGFSYQLSLLYMVVGLLSCVFGIALFVLRQLEPPEQPAETRLSSNFISAGATVVFSGLPQINKEQGSD